MAFLNLVVRRLAAQRLLAVGLLVTMAFCIGVLVAGPIYADGSGRAIVGGTVARALVTQRNVRYSVQSSPRFNVIEADSVVRDAAGALPVATIVRQAATGAIGAVGPSGTRLSTQVAYRIGAFQHLQIDGSPPRAPGEVVLASGDAYRLGVDRGDVITVRSSSAIAHLRVTGLYHVPGSDDPFWFGAESLLYRQPGQDVQPSPTVQTLDLLPLLTTDQGFGHVTEALGIASGPEYAWDVYLNLSGLDLDQLGAVAHRVETVAGRISARASSLAYLSTDTSLSLLVDRATNAVGQARSPIYLVVFQIAAVAFAVLAGVASLSLSRQSFELAVLKSRGFGRAKLLAAQAAESGVAALLALPLGILVGLGLAAWGRAVHGPSLAEGAFVIRLGATAVAAGVAAAVVGAVLVLAMSLPHVLRTVQQERQQLSREGRPLLARFPFELLGGALGGTAFWEVQRRGLGAQRGSIDPLVLLAPTLLLFAASFFALRVLLWGLGRLDGPVGRARAFPVYLAGRRLGRSTSLSFATALLLLLATGLLVVSSGYRHTLLTAHADVARQRVGAAWSVEVAPMAQSLAALRRIPSGDTALYRGQVEGIDTSAFSASDVDLAAAGSALSTADVVGLDPATYASGGWWRRDYGERSLPDLLDELRPERWGAALPAGTERLSLRVSVPRSVAGFALRAVVATPGGVTRTVTFQPLRPGTAAYSAPVPGARWLLSLVVDKQRSILAPPSFTLTVEQMQALTAAGSSAVGLDGWRALRWDGSSGVVRVVGASIRATLRPGGAAITAGIAPPGGVMPALVSQDLAFLAGRSVNVVVCGMGVTLRVGSGVQWFPGVAAPTFVVLPAPTLLAELERVPGPCGGINEIRAMGGSSPVPALRPLHVNVVQVRDAHTMEAALSQDPQTLALGMHFAGAAGGMVLVVVGLGVALYFGQRRWNFEFAALRALGAERRQLVAALAGEQGFLTLFAMVVAVALGYGLLDLILPYAAGNLSSNVPPGGLAMDWPAVLGLGAAAVGVVAAGLALGIRSLFASSVPSVLRGEAE